jgi:hypothetical protein
MRRSTLIVGGVAVLVVGGVLVIQRTSAAKPASLKPNELMSTAPDTTLTVPTQPQPDNAGAEHAATAAVRMTGKIATAGFISRADLIGTISSARFAPTLAARSAAQLADMTAEVGGAGVTPTDLVWQELPLTSHVTGTTGTTATVDVWSVLIVGVPGHGAPRQVWRTVTIGLVWERSAWRIDKWDAVAGPTPALAATAPISDVTAIRIVLSWPSVGGDG